MQEFVTLYNYPSVLRRYTALYLQQYDMPAIGVGGERAIRHFIRSVQSYTGFDFAAGVVRHCPGALPAGQYPDSRLSEKKVPRPGFSDNGFDFLLSGFHCIGSECAAYSIMLLQAGFTGVKCYDVNGKELTAPSSAIKDHCLHVCTV